MSTGAILLTCAGLGISASLIIALVLHFWPRYGSVAAAIEHSDHFLEQMDAVHTSHS